MLFDIILTSQRNISIIFFFSLIRFFKQPTQKKTSDIFLILTLASRFFILFDFFSPTIMGLLLRDIAYSRLLGATSNQVVRSSQRRQQGQRSLLVVSVVSGQWRKCAIRPPFFKILSDETFKEQRLDHKDGLQSKEPFFSCHYTRHSIKLLRLDRTDKELQLQTGDTQIETREPQRILSRRMVPPPSRRAATSARGQKVRYGIS